MNVLITEELNLSFNQDRAEHIKIQICTQASEQNAAQLEEDKKHLEFMNSIKKYDADVAGGEAAGEGGTAGGGSGEMTASTASMSMDGSKDAMAELFQDDGEDDRGGVGGGGSPTPPSSTPSRPTLATRSPPG